MEAKFDAVELAHKIMIIVTLQRMHEFQIRLWIAKQLFRLAGRIANLNLEVIDEKSDGAM